MNWKEKEEGKKIKKSGPKRKTAELQSPLSLFLREPAETADPSLREEGGGGGGGGVVSYTVQ